MTVNEDDLKALKALADKWVSAGEYAGPCGTGCSGCTAAANAGELRRAIGAIELAHVAVQEPETIVTYDEQTDCMFIRSTFRILVDHHHKDDG